MVFVSCNPHGHTLRRDYVVRGGNLAANARILCSRGATPPFRLRSAVPVDLFRDTPHCELVLAFERAEPRQKPRGPRAGALHTSLHTTTQLPSRHTSDKT